MIGLKDLRTKAGFTQSQVAEMLGVKQSTVAMWETGINEPKSANLIKIAEVFDCSIDNLLKGDRQEGNLNDA